MTLKKISLVLMILVTTNLGAEAGWLKEETQKLENAGSGLETAGEGMEAVAKVGESVASE